MAAKADEEMTRKQAASESEVSIHVIDRARSRLPGDPLYLASHKRPGDGVGIYRIDFQRWNYYYRRLLRSDGAALLLALLVLFLAGAYIACACGSAEACEILRFLDLPLVRNNL